MNDSGSPWRYNIHQGEGKGWLARCALNQHQRGFASLSFTSTAPFLSPTKQVSHNTTAPGTGPLRPQISLDRGQTHHGGFKAKNAHRRWPLQPEGCDPRCKPAAVLPKGMLSSLLHPGPAERWVPWGREEGARPSVKQPFLEAKGTLAPNVLHGVIHRRCFFYRAISF